MVPLAKNLTHSSSRSRSCAALKPANAAKFSKEAPGDIVFFVFSKSFAHFTNSI